MALDTEKFKRQQVALKEEFRTLFHSAEDADKIYKLLFNTRGFVMTLHSDMFDLIAPEDEQVDTMVKELEEYVGEAYPQAD